MVGSRNGNACGALHAELTPGILVPALPLASVLWGSLALPSDGGAECDLGAATSPLCACISVTEGGITVPALPPSVWLTPDMADADGRMKGRPRDADAEAHFSHARSAGVLSHSAPTVRGVAPVLGAAPALQRGHWTLPPLTHRSTRLHRLGSPSASHWSDRDRRTADRCGTLCQRFSGQCAHEAALTSARNLLLLGLTRYCCPLVLPTHSVLVARGTASPNL